MAITRVGRIRIPAAGGAYLRLLPFGITRRAVREHARSGRAGVFYTHPWEIDPDQPRLDVPLVPRLRHYGRLSRTLPRLERLMSQFRFASIAECYPDDLESTPASGGKTSRTTSSGATVGSRDA